MGFPKSAHRIFIGAAVHAELGPLPLSQQNEKRSVYESVSEWAETAPSDKVRSGGNAPAPGAVSCGLIILNIRIRTIVQSSAHAGLLGPWGSHRGLGRELSGARRGLVGS